MEDCFQIDGTFIENNTVFTELIEELKHSFAGREVIVPTRHHHHFPNPEVQADSTLLLMPAWWPGKTAGVKIVTINPENARFDLPSIQGTYIYLDAIKGTTKAILEAKSLTAKRTAAASALASSFLSGENASSMLMIGTGALSINLIKAHASVRPINTVYVWGRDLKKANAVCYELREAHFTSIPIKTIEEKISHVDIVSCATLSKTPLVMGQDLRPGQHIDLVGAYKKDMREADDATIKKGILFVDTREGVLEESGDIIIPLQNGIIKKEDIKADLFELCSGKGEGRINQDELTIFKSAGHALEDLTAASYFYKKYANAQHL